MEEEGQQRLRTKAFTLENFSLFVTHERAEHFLIVSNTDPPNRFSSYDFIFSCRFRVFSTPSSIKTVNQPGHSSCNPTPQITLRTVNEINCSPWLLAEFTAAFYLLYLNGDIINDKQMGCWQHSGRTLRAQQPPPAAQRGFKARLQIRLYLISLFDYNTGAKLFRGEDAADSNAIDCALRGCVRLSGCVSAFLTFSKQNRTLNATRLLILLLKSYLCSVIRIWVFPLLI